MQKIKWSLTRHTFLFVLPIAMLASGTIALFKFVYSEETIHIQNEFELHTAIMFKELQEIFESQHHVLNSLQALFTAEDIDRTTFGQFASQVLTLHPNIQALEWIPRVQSNRRTEYEAMVARQGFTGFQIREYDREKKLVPAGRRSEYYPVDYIVPFTGNEPAFGFDLASDPIRREALHQSCVTNDFVATGRITLIQEKGKQYGFLVFAPVFRKNTAHETAEERRGNLAGFVLGVFRAGDLIDEFFKNTLPQGISFQVFNDTSLTAENMLSSEGSSEGHGTSMEKIRTFPFAGRTWAVRFIAPDTVVTAQRTRYPYLVLAVGLISTVLLGLFLNSIARRSEKIQRIIEQRTAELQQTTAMLSIAQIRQKAILENIPHLAWLKDNDGRFLEVNKLFARSCGYPAEEVIGKTDFDVWPQALAEKYHSDDRAVMHEGRPKFVEEPIADADGAHWFETFKTPVFDESGTVIGTAGLALNITGRKLLEEELTRERKRLENVITGTKTGVWEWNVQTGEATFNERWAEIAGYTLAELAPISIKTWLDLAHPDDLKVSNDLLAKHFAGELDYYSCDCRLKHKEGYWVWVLDRGKVITLTEDGKPLLMQGTHQDITERKQVEEKLHELKLAVEQSTDGIAFADMNGHIQFVNEAWAGMHGYAVDELTGRHLSIFHTPEQLEKEVLPFNEHAIKTGSSKGELGHVRKNGEIFPTWMNTTAVKFSGEKAFGFIGIARDISQQKLINDALLQTTDRLRLATKAGGVGIWDYDVVNNRLIWDDQMYHLYGITEQQFGGAYEAWQSGLHPDDLQQGDAEIQMALRGEKEFDTEFRVVWPDGTIHNLRALAIVQRDASGQALSMVGTNWDITKSKRIEQMITRHMKELARINTQLYQEKEKTELILNDVGDGVAVADMQGRIVRINNIAKNLLGFTETIVEGSMVDGLFAHCSLTVAQQKIIHTLITPESFSTTVALEPPVELDVKCTILHDENRNRTGQVFVFHDVTRLKEVDRMKSDFVSSVSHELRTPLTSIKGFTATILHDPQMSEMTRLDFLSIINKETDRLTRLIEDILEISRIEAGKVEVHIKLYSVEEVAEKIFPLIKTLADSKELQFECCIQKGLPTLTGDSDKIHSVFSNLLGNAVKFTPAGGLVRFSAFQKDAYVIAQIMDTGLGIPEKDISHIFERFYRVHRPGTQIPGTGLGLAICRELINLHGGHIEVQSTLNKGTVFSVYLPVTSEQKNCPA
ncbi:MAG: PAS domain S-box protein [Pseudomonadota bacterium]